ncbi:MAG: hypothetical protein EPN93_00995 [Spirochaetes bacterium]|nr:MAG: hypothetical protein EPN93_00995 [Spirochaetota bacterium]
METTNSRGKSCIIYKSFKVFMSFILLAPILLYDATFSQNRVATTNYPLENIVLIKNSFDYGEIKEIKADLLQQILVGEWRSTPSEFVTFKTDGTFKVRWNNSWTPYEGQWKAEDNAILFRVKIDAKGNLSEWKVSKITHTEYRLCESCGSRESFMIKLEHTYFDTWEIHNAYFLTGQICINFN